MIKKKCIKMIMIIWILKRMRYNDFDDDIGDIEDLDEDEDETNNNENENNKEDIIKNKD